MADPLVATSEEAAVAPILPSDRALRLLRRCSGRRHVMVLADVARAAASSG